MSHASPASVASDDAPQTPGAADGVLLANLANLSITDESSVDVQSSASGSYAIDTSKTNNRTGFSPGLARYSPPFVREGAESLKDDPFRSPSRRSSSQRTPHAHAATRAAMSAHWRSRSSSGSSSGSAASSPSADKATRDSKHAGKGDSFYAVQERVSKDADSQLAAYTIKPEDSQAIYPPSCCVFVANLLQSESEEALQVAVTQVFREYGPVFVKIRRDAKQMPFAFCQYTEPEHAELAIKNGRGRLIKGRPCRCEKAKAHRLFFVERKYGTVVTPEEVQDLLQSFGKIEFCRAATHVERTALNLNDGVIVQFEMYDEGQAAHSAFRNHELYKLQAIAGLASPSRAAPSRSPSTAENRAYLECYEVDRRSVFVGNLPLGTTETQLLQLFEHYGTIDHIILRETASKFEIFDKFCFAFIEFRSPTAVSKAIAAKNGFSFGGKTLRVSQKDSENAKHRSRRVHPSNATAPTSSYQSPAPRQVEQQPVSPMAQMSPQGYGSPYAYPFSNPFYGYPSNALYTDSQGQYYTVPYSPYYSYPGSPTYGAGVSTESAVNGSPTSQQAYYGYYPYASAPYYGMANPSTHQQQATPPATYYPPTYSLPMASSTTPEDQSATPTPAGHSPVVDSSLESQ